MAIEVQTRFVARTTVRIIAYVYNDSDELVNPTSIKLSLWDADGKLQVNAATMDDLSPAVTGTFWKYCETAVDSAKGQWRGEVVTVDGDDEITSIGLFGFEVM